MAEAILNLLLLVFAFAVFVLWAQAVAESDGKCHIGDCGHCPYSGACKDAWSEEE